MNKVTFDCCICGRAITCPEPHMHYCDDCGDGPFCEACYEAHRREETAQWHRWEAEEAEDEAWHMGEAAAYASGRAGEDDHG